MKSSVVVAIAAVLAFLSGACVSQSVSETEPTAAIGRKACRPPGVQATFEEAGEGRRVDYCLQLPLGYAAPENLWRRYPVVYHLGGRHEDSRSAQEKMALHVVAQLSPQQLVDELIPHIDATYRTIDSRSGRGIDLGGQGTAASTEALDETFCSVRKAADNEPGEHATRCGWRHLPARFGFAPASGIAEIRRQHLALPNPAEEVWWTPTGDDMRWNNKNLHQFVPTVNLYRDGPVKEIPLRPNLAVARFPIETPSGTLGYLDFLDSEHSSTMGVVIVHRGAIVFEHYPRMEPYEKPIWWSVTKVLVSTVLGILEERGLFEVDEAIETYVPELAGSDFAGVSVRNILDMASGVDCPDGDYTDRSTCYYQFEASLGDAVRSEGTPDNPYDMLASLDVGSWAEQGKGFDYSGANTFVLGWLVEKLTGLPFHDAFTREVWSRIGAEGDASIFAGRYGIPLTSGGLLARPRDMARFGLLFTPSWSVVSDRPLLSERLINHLKDGGRPELLENSRYGNALRPGIKHSVYQWDRVFENNDLYKGGWAGQGLLVNPDRDLVAVWVGYSKDADEREMAHLPILRGLLEDVFGEGDG